MHLNSSLGVLPTLKIRSETAKKSEQATRPCRMKTPYLIPIRVLNLLRYFSSASYSLITKNQNLVPNRGPRSTGECGTRLNGGQSASPTRLLRQPRMDCFTLLFKRKVELASSLFAQARDLHASWNSIPIDRTANFLNGLPQRIKRNNVNRRVRQERS